MNEQHTFMRAFPAQIERKGRVLTGRLVPYDVIADVLDQFDGKLDVYQEGFRRGAFDGQVINGATNKGVLSRIGLVHRHDGGLGYLGPFTGLREASDGLYGDVRILPTKEADVGALLEEGVDELSVEFRLRWPEPNTSIDDSGVRWRTKVHLDQVALEPKGAYASAQVLQYRNEMDDLKREQAEREEAERAAAQQAADERAAAEAAANEAIERRRAWDEMTERLATEQERQQQLVNEYGITKPGGYGSLQ